MAKVCGRMAVYLFMAMALLEEFAAAGGKLVMGCRTGYKDMDGQCVTEYPSGPQGWC